MFSPSGCGVRLCDALNIAPRSTVRDHGPRRLGLQLLQEGRAAFRTFPSSGVPSPQGEACALVSRCTAHSYLWLRQKGNNRCPLGSRGNHANFQR